MTEGWPTATFTCEACGGTFGRKKNWTEADATKEMRERLGEILADDQASVCDGCYEELCQLLGAG